jgi:hypothetical protein
VPPSRAKRDKSKETVFFRGVFLRAVCYSDTQGWLGFPWPLPRGWAKTCATLPWPIRGWSLQVFVLPPYAAKPMRRERVSRLPQAPSAARPGLDAGATRALHCVAFQGGRTAASRCRPGERLPSCAHPRRLPAMGSLPQRPDPAAHSPARKRLLEQQPASVWLGSGGAPPPDGAHDTARCTRRERACPARAVPATDVHRRVGPRAPTAAGGLLPGLLQCRQTAQEFAAAVAAARVHTPRCDSCPMAGVHSDHGGRCDGSLWTFRELLTAKFEPLDSQSSSG